MKHWLPCLVQWLTVWCCWILAGEDISNVQLPSQLSDINHSEIVSRIIPDNSCEPVMTMKISHQPKSYKIVRVYTADTAHILMITYPNCSSKQITSCTPSMPWALVKSRTFLNSNCFRNSAQLAKSASGLDCASVTLTNRVAITVDTRKTFIIVYLRAHLWLSLLHRLLLDFASAIFGHAHPPTHAHARCMHVANLLQDVCSRSFCGSCAHCILSAQLRYVTMWLRLRGLLFHVGK